MKRLLLPFLIVALLCGVVTGCGQKGPLYHPDEAGHQKHKDDQFGF